MPSIRFKAKSKRKRSARAHQQMLEREKNARGIRVGNTRLMYGQAQAMAHTLQHWLDEEQPET